MSTCFHEKSAPDRRLRHSRIRPALLLLILMAPLRADAQVWEGGFGSPRTPGSIEDAIVYDSRLVVMYRPHDVVGIDELNGEALAVYDAGNWQALLSVTGGTVDHPPMRLSRGGLTVWNDDLVVGGEFWSLDGTLARNVGRLHDGQWQPLGGGVPRMVGALGTYRDHLLAAPQGGACPIGPNQLFYAFDGANWSAVDLPPGYSWGRVDCFLEQQGILFLGGTFVPEGSTGQNVICVLQYDGSTFTPVGDGIRNDTERPVRKLPTALVGVHALKTFGGNIYAAGTFRESGTGLEAMARLDGGRWIPIPIRGYLSDLVVYDQRLVPVGDYEVRDASGAWQRSFAGWDGQAWTTLEDREYGRSQLQQIPIAAVTWQDRLVFCGATNDTREDGYRRHTPILSDFDGQAWTRTTCGPAQQGIPGLALTTCVYRGDWILGGRFEWAGPHPVTNVARWDGARWHNLGEGLYPVSECTHVLTPVRSLVVYGDELYAGGRLRIGPDGPRTCLAMWDGQRWADVGGGTSSPAPWDYGGILDFAIYDGRLAVIGDFDLAGGRPANGIALWDGSQWDLSIPGPDSVLFGDHPKLSCATVRDGQLYVGGDFASLGGVRCDGLGRWDGQAWHPVSPMAGAVAISDIETYQGDLYILAHDLPRDPEWVRRVHTTFRRVDADSIRSVELLGADTPNHSSGTLLSLGDGIYVGGTYLARWDGDAAEAILPPSGDNPRIYSMAALDGSLAMGLDPYHAELCGAGILHLDEDFAPNRMAMGGNRAGETVRVEWTLEGFGSQSTIALQRRDAGGDWQELARWPAPDAIRLGGWSDDVAALNSEVEYRLVAERDDQVVAEQSWVAAPAVDPATPLTTRILGSQPNPFNPATTLRFAYDGTGPVVVKIYNTAGREVRSIELGVRAPGVYQVEWRGTDNSGAPVGSGVYLVRMAGGQAKDIQKVTLIK